MNKLGQLYARLMKGVGANAYGQAVTVLTQLLSVPLLIHYWGMPGYGEWIILSALPAYLIMSDFGVGAVAANKMVFNDAANNNDGVLLIYRSLVAFNMTVSLVLMLSVVVTFIAFNAHEVMGISNLSEGEVNLVLLLLSAQVLISMQVNVLSAAFRSKNMYAEGAFWSHSSRLIEWIFGVLFLLFEHGVLAFAIGLVFGRLIGYMAMYMRLIRLDSTYRLSVRGAEVSTIREMIRPGLGFMAFPLGLAVIIQGLTLVVGGVLGSIAVAQFTILRTISRILIQLVTMVNQAFWPELSRAYGGGDDALVQRLYVDSFRYSVVLGFFGVLILTTLDDYFFGFWVGEGFTVNDEVFSLLLVAAFLNIVGQSGWVLLMATNKHVKFSILYVVSAVLAVLLGFVLLKDFGMSGAAYVLIIFEMVVLVFSVVEVLKILSLSLGNVVGRLVSIRG